MTKTVLIISATLLALLALIAGRAPGTLPASAADGGEDGYAWRVYLPLVMTRPSEIFSVPLRIPSSYFGIEGESRYYISWGYTPQQAYEGNIGVAGIIARTTVQREYVGSNTYYNIYRGFIEVEIPEFAGEVITAGLRLIPDSAGEAVKAPVVGFYRGMWPDGAFPASTSEAQTLWTAWTPDGLVGQFDTADDYCFGAQTCEFEPGWEPRYTLIPLDPECIVSGGRLKLVMRDMEDDKNVVELYGGDRTFSPFWLSGNDVKTPEDLIWGWIEFGVQ